jgi:spore maturation protein CgeB
MPEKLRYCGARAADFWPLGLFEVAHDPAVTEEALFARERDIDVVFRLHRGKMDFLARVKKALGSQLRMHGLTSPARNVYWNVMHGFPGWIRPARFEEYVPLYQRAKIGFNAHNRGDYIYSRELPAVRPPGKRRDADLRRRRAAGCVLQDR